MSGVGWQDVVAALMVLGALGYLVRRKLVQRRMRARAEGETLCDGCAGCAAAASATTPVLPSYGNNGPASAVQLPVLAVITDAPRVR